MARPSGSNPGVGILLIILGCYFLARNFGWLDFYIEWRTWWPFILVIVGAWWMIRSLREQSSGTEEKK